ncbi:MAG: acyl-CoA thioesterase [Candidatus Omnitrophica bacterium]|nr:acyl-CoA thioesterase [Candidatus Omnitrophota bacterium]
MRVKEESYFKKIPAAPEPLIFKINRRVSFNEVDIMGIVWYGQYAIYFEQAQTELGRRYGLSFKDFFKTNLRAPIVKFHIDYYQPLYLDEEFTIQASYIWSEGAKLHIEYTVIKKDGAISTRG